MKGIIVAGGLGTRVGDSTKVTNKHCLPIFDKPMIRYPLDTLLSLGIKDIAIVFSPPFGGQIITLLGNGEDLGCRITYLVQTKPDGGIADALLRAEGFAQQENIAVILGDNAMDCPEVKVEDFTRGARIYLKEVDCPSEFGVAELVGEEILSIVEKPQTPPSNLAVVGLYLYDPSVWNKIRSIKPSNRGQLEITDVNNLYLKEHSLQWRRLRGFWQDAGTPEKMLASSIYWKEKSCFEKEGSNFSLRIIDLIDLSKKLSLPFSREDWLKAFSLTRSILPLPSYRDPKISLKEDFFTLHFYRKDSSLKICYSGGWRLKDRELTFKEAKDIIEEFFLKEAAVDRTIELKGCLSFLQQEEDIRDVVLKRIDSLSVRLSEADRGSLRDKDKFNQQLIGKRKR